jgi:fructose-bisphosphate aldolase, class II
MPHVATSTADLLDTISGAAHVDGGRLVIDDEAQFRSQAIRDLAWTAAFTTDEPTAEATRWIVWEASQALGARSASIQGLYMARSRGEVSGFTVPAVNLRAQTFDMARTFLSVAKEREVGALIFEIARSEQTYTFQRPQDFATSVLAGAIAAGHVGPVFIQGDHYQFNAKKYAADPEAMTEEIRRACRLAIDAGYRNIDIDSSTLVDLSQPSLDLEQRENYTRAAELTALIRSLETDGVTVSVGGEIGEVGKANSTVDELKAYLDGYTAVLQRLAPGARGVSKVSVQTGTSHGGIPLPGGGVAEVKLDFEVLRALGEVARSYGLAGAVQHGASTLPDELFHKFPTVETAEIHLATGFQNALYDHPAFPKSLMDEIYAWCQVNAADERKAGQTEDQFLYTTRKKAIGPFKRQLWDLETKDEILASQGAKMGFLFDQLKVPGTADLVARHVQPVPLARPIPEALRAALAG